MEIARVAKWREDNNLLINISKTKDIVFSNPNPPALVINNIQLERVNCYTYLGTVLTNKLSFSENTARVVNKARKRLHIMSKLKFLGVSETIRRTTYTTFIQSLLTHHLCTSYGHLTANDRKLLNKVTKNASFLGDIELDSLDEYYHSQLKAHDLFLDLEPILTFEQLPSGHLRVLRARTNLRLKSLRSKTITVLNQSCF